MTGILLINPNTSQATTAMMLAVVRRHLPPGMPVHAVTASVGPAMIVDGAALAGSVDEVVRLGLAEAAGARAVVVAAFGDPGVERLRTALAVPVVGIGEAAIREAASGGRRFGIATTTPALVGAIESLIGRLDLADDFTGVRVPPADPLALAADPARQDEALADAVRTCLEHDAADVVVIGGGPLSETAARLHARHPGAIVEPLPASVRMLERLGVRM